MIIIVRWTHHERTIEGTAVKQVECEKCATTYFYKMTRRGVGQGRTLYGLNNPAAARAAASEAEQALTWILARDCEPVPCPKCGWLQKPMVAKIQQSKYKFMNWMIGVVPVAVAMIITAIETYVDQADHETGPGMSGLLLGALAGIALIMLRRSLRASYDPNSRYPVRPDPIPGAPTATLTPEAL